MNITTNSTASINSTLVLNSTLSPNSTSFLNLTNPGLMIDPFDLALKKYPIEVTSISAAFLGIYIILTVLLTIIAFGHRAHLILLCYRVIPKKMNKSKVRRQFWLHTLYCFMVLYSVFKVVNFVVIMYRSATLQLSAPDLSFIQVDIFLSDVAIVITIQIFLVVLNSVAFSTAKKAAIIVTRVILVLCLLNGLLYVALLTVGYTMLAIVGLNFHYISIFLVALNKVVLVTIMIIIGICMRKLVGNKNKEAKSLTRRLMIMVVLLVIATIVIFACTGVGNLVDQAAVVFTALIAMGIPTITVFMVVIIIFWPSRFSCKILKKTTLSGNGMQLDTSSETETTSTPSNLITDNNQYALETECGTPTVNNHLSFSVQGTGNGSDSPTPLVNDNCDQAVVENIENV
ncbi:hypothetical protein AKO1_006146 [Acrasis kona]|uniref:Uncharacterized protein n=1 Tax=Acrasis kona TaxID=1008807 RepID=A0AAW2YHM6_9EUKA